MVTHACSRFWPGPLLLTAIMLVYPPSAHADRIDIDDPSVLGPVCSAMKFTTTGSCYQRELPRFGTQAGSIGTSML